MTENNKVSLKDCMPVIGNAGRADVDAFLSGDAKVAATERSWAGSPPIAG